MNKFNKDILNRGEFAGKPAVFYCPLCQPIPQIKESEIAVKSPHPECTIKEFNKVVQLIKQN